MPRFPSSLDPHIEEELLRRCLPIVRRLARQAWRRAGKRIPLDDLVEVGWMAAFAAVRRYDPAVSPLLPYATLRIRWALQSATRREARRASRMQRAEDLGVLLPPATGDPHGWLARKRSRAALRSAVDALGEPSGVLVARHYFAGEPIARVASELGVPVHAAHRLHRAAVRALRRRLQRERDDLAETLPVESSP